MLVFWTVFVCPFLLMVIQLHWNFKLYCFYFSKIWASKLGVRLIYRCGLYTDVYGKAYNNHSYLRQFLPQNKRGYLGQILAHINHGYLGQILAYNHRGYLGQIYAQRNCCYLGQILAQNCHSNLVQILAQKNGSCLGHIIFGSEWQSVTWVKFWLIRKPHSCLYIIIVP